MKLAEAPKSFIDMAEQAMDKQQAIIAAERRLGGSWRKRGEITDVIIIERPRSCGRLLHYTMR